MNQRENRRSDDYNDRSRHPHNRHDESRSQDRFGDDYHPRRANDNWRDEPRDEHGRFQRRDEQPRGYREDDYQRRDFRSYDDAQGGRGYGLGRREDQGADYGRGYDNDASRRPSREPNSPGYRPNATSGYIRDQQQRTGNYTQSDYDHPRRLGYDDARNLPERGDFDRGSDRFYQNYRDDYTRRPERHDEQPRRHDGRRDEQRDDRRPRYDGSNRDGARSDYGYGDDYSSSLYDPNSRNSAFRRRDDDHDDRRQPDRGRRWSDTPDLDNQPRR